MDENILLSHSSIRALFLYLRMLCVKKDYRQSLGSCHRKMHINISDRLSGKLQEIDSRRERDQIRHTLLDTSRERRVCPIRNEARDPIQNATPTQLLESTRTSSRMLQ